MTSDHNNNMLGYIFNVAEHESALRLAVGVLFVVRQVVECNGSLG